MKYQPVPVVLTPLDEHMGLDIARALHKRGIPVHGVDHDPHAVGRYSNACRFARSPDPQKDARGYVDFLVNFSQRFECKPVLIPLSDEHVLTISRNRDSLKPHYEFVMPPGEIIEALCTKSGLIEVTRKLNIPAPATYFPTSAADVERIAHQIPYPALIKPGESPQWHDPLVERELRRGLLDGRAKVVLCPTAEGLLAAYRRLAAINPNLIVQEVIPGEDSRLYYVSFYMNRQSQPLAAFSGRKDRVIPIGFGSASFVHSYYDPALIEMGLRVFQGMGYQGLGGIEFKKDPRDETYKLIEVNTRFGMWDGLGARCGVDLGYIAYCDTLNLPVDPQLNFRTGIIWMDWQRDLRAAVAYIRMRILTWGAWLKSFRGEKMWAIYSVSDPLPGIFFTFRLVRIFLARLLPR